MPPMHWLIIGVGAWLGSSLPVGILVGKCLKGRSAPPMAEERPEAPTVPPSQRLGQYDRWTA